MSHSPHRALHPALILLPVPQGEAEKRKPGAPRAQEEPGAEVPVVVSSACGAGARAGDRAAGDAALRPCSLCSPVGSILDWGPRGHVEHGVCNMTMCGPQELAAEEPCPRLAPPEAATRESSVDRLAQLGPGTKSELPSAVSPR